MSDNKKPIILGIDPGYDRVGWAVGQYTGSKFITSGLGCIQTNNKENIFSRYKQIQQELEEILNTFAPKVLAIETLFFSKNKKTAMRVSEARGVIISSCLAHNLNVFEYDPVQIKAAVAGNGKADKQSVEKMVKLQTEFKSNNQIDDAIDALAVAMTFAFTNVY